MNLHLQLKATLETFLKGIIQRIYESTHLHNVIVSLYSTLLDGDYYKASSSKVC